MLLRLWTKHLWLYAMFIGGFGVLYAAIMNWHVWPAAQKVSACVYMVLPLHAWEEWSLPGGYAYQYNWIRGKNSDRPDRYPMNQLTHVMMYTAGMSYGLMLLYIGAGPAILISRLFFTLMEVVVHLGDGVKMKRRFAAKGKANIYNPGLVTAMVGFLPILLTGVWVVAHMSLGLKDLLASVGLLGVAVAITVLPEKLVDRKLDAEYAYHPGYYKQYISK